MVMVKRRKHQDYFLCTTFVLQTHSTIFLIIDTSSEIRKQQASHRHGQRYVDVDVSLDVSVGDEW
jgi:hypothetical protein